MRGCATDGAAADRRPLRGRLRAVPPLTAAAAAHSLKPLLTCGAANTRARDARDCASRHDELIDRHVFALQQLTEVMELPAARGEHAAELDGPALAAMRSPLPDTARARSTEPWQACTYQADRVVWTGTATCAKSSEVAAGNTPQQRAMQVHVNRPTPSARRVADRDACLHATGVAAPPLAVAIAEAVTEDTASHTGQAHQLRHHGIHRGARTDPTQALLWRARGAYAADRFAEHEMAQTVGPECAAPPQRRWDRLERLCSVSARLTALLPHGHQESLGQPLHRQ